MADLNDPLPGSGVGFWTIAAAAAGSLLTLRTLIESSPLVRAGSVVSSFMVGFFAAPWISEVMGWSPKGERLAALVLSWIGVNLLAGLATFSLKWAKDPQAAVAWAFSLWRGNSGGPT